MTTNGTNPKADTVEVARKAVVKADLALRRAELVVDQDAQSVGRIVGYITLLATVLVAFGASYGASAVARGDGSAFELTFPPSNLVTYLFAGVCALVLLTLIALLVNHLWNRNAAVTSQELETAMLVLIEEERKLEKTLKSAPATPQVNVPFKTVISAGVVAGVVGGWIARRGSRTFG